MLADLRFAFRSLTRNRGFTLIVVLTLALGIGSAAAILACVVPARRATKVDISQLLRSE